MGYDTEQAEYFMYDEDYREAMEGPDCFDVQKISCGCDNSHIWYDDKLGIYQCRNCGWCS